MAGYYLRTRRECTPECSRDLAYVQRRGENRTGIPPVNRGKNEDAPISSIDLNAVYAIGHYLLSTVSTANLSRARGTARRRDLGDT